MDKIILRPSSAARRVACPGSRALEALYPQQPSTASEEGTLAHSVAASVLRGEVPQLSDFVTEEMIEGAQLYRQFIESHNNESLHIEQKLDISLIHPNCEGTPDAWGRNGGTINIYDYKYGHGFVEVFENWQLIEYAAGIIPRMEADTTVNLHIVQPRSFHPEGQMRTWSTTAGELQPYFHALIDAEFLSMQDLAQTKVSSQCNNCPARHACPALQASAMAAVDISMSSIPNDLTPVQISTELRLLQHAYDLLDARISGLSAEALALIQRGERLPHYQAQRVISRERWAKPAEEIMALGDMFGVELRKHNVITPKQAITAKIPADIVRQYSETPVGDLKLVAIDTRKTDKIFGGG